MTLKNHSMLKELMKQRKHSPCSVGHVCSVVLEELAREGKSFTLEEFLMMWNKFIGRGNWYARVAKENLEEEVYGIALDMLTHLLVSELKIPEKCYHKIFREIYPEIYS